MERIPTEWVPNVSAYGTGSGLSLDTRLAPLLGMRER